MGKPRGIKMNDRVIAVFNQAGGVGKTSLVNHLGYLLACQKRFNPKTQKRSQKKGDYYRVLLVDMDPQASLTIFLGLEPYELEKTVYHGILKDEPLPILQGIYALNSEKDSQPGVDLVPANLELAIAERELTLAVMSDFRLKEAISHLSEKYDFILIDCPPSLGNLAYISLVAATHVLVPIQAQYKAFNGVQQLFETIKLVRGRPNPQLKFAGFVPTMYDARNSHDERTVVAMNEQLSALAPVYPPIPRSTIFADASEAHLPLALYDKKHPALKVMKQIVSGLEQLNF
jgi:chromosome partitioning protein